MKLFETQKNLVEEYFINLNSDKCKDLVFVIIK